MTATLAGPLVPASSGRDFYVNNLLGNDTFSGLDEKVSGKNGPVKTIGRALQLAHRSDRVSVINTGAPYREQIALSAANHQGTKRRPFVLQSDGAVIDGTVTAQRGAWRPVGGDVFALRPRRLAYQQLFRDGKPLPQVRLASTPAAPRQALETALQPLEWSLVNDELLFRVEQDKLPESYPLRHAGLQTGITLYGVRHVIVEGFIVQGFQQDGVNTHDRVKNCRLRNLELRANGRSGLSVSGASRVIVEQCRVYDNGAAQVRTEGLAELDLRKSEVEAALDPGSSRAAPAFDDRGRVLIVDGVPYSR